MMGRNHHYFVGVAVTALCGWTSAAADVTITGAISNHNAPQRLVIPVDAIKQAAPDPASGERGALSTSIERATLGPTPLGPMSSGAIFNGPASNGPTLVGLPPAPAPIDGLTAAGRLSLPPAPTPIERPQKGAEISGPTLAPQVIAPTLAAQNNAPQPNTPLSATSIALPIVAAPTASPPSATAPTKSSPVPTLVAAPPSAAPVVLAAATNASGSLYREVVQATVDGALAKALGSAAYILRDMGVGNEFRAKVRNAVGRHPAYHAQAADLEQTSANRRRERAALYPQISTSLNGDYAIKRDFATDTDNVVEALRPREQFTAAISASQLVYDGGATFQRIKSARARNQETRNAISVRINDLSLATLAAYHDLLTHQALVGLGDAFIRRHETILDSAKERERLGAGSKADVTQTRARLASATARVAEIRESKQLAEIRYLEFFKTAPNLLARPSFSKVAINSRQEAVAAATHAHPEIAAATARATASRADFKAAKGARLPEIRVSVDAVKFDLFDSGDDFEVRTGLNLNYNLFGGGARSADIAAARARAKREDFSAEQVKQDIARDAAIAFERRVGAEARLSALETAVINHNKTRALVLERYRVARGDLIDVLQAENDYFESGAAYLTGLANRDMAIYGLMEHTGDLLRYFSPQPEYNDVALGDADAG